MPESVDDVTTVDPRSEHTYRVIHLVATSATSWEGAARKGIAEAAKTITGLDQARVRDMQIVVGDDATVQYRIELELEFQLDRRRRNPVVGALDIEVRRYLIVANETLAGDHLPALVADRIGGGPSEFHILVPATRSRETRRLAAAAGDPFSGYAVLEMVGLDEAVARDRAGAEDRLVTFTSCLGSLGADFSSEIGVPDAFFAIAQVMERASFDEIIISTLPSVVSHWLRLDLPSRVRRSYSLPVVIITVDS